MIKELADWSKLPVEVLSEILRLAWGTRHGDNYALVCKSWSIPAQNMLWSRIVVRSNPQLRELHNKIQLYPHLGERVKQLIISSEINGYNQALIFDREEALNLVSSILSGGLPNLKEADIGSLYTFTPILNALLGSYLQRLEKINFPNEFTKGCEVADFAICSMLMKTRIRKLEILRKFARKQGLDYKRHYFDRLYNHLHQFNKLTELVIDKTTDDGIRDLEYITDNCKSLKRLEVNFKAESVSPARNNISITEKEISSFAPSHDIEELSFTSSMPEDCQILLYVMHKFQKLRKLDLSMAGDSIGRLNQHMAFKLIDYASNVEDCNMKDLRMDDHPIWETISKYWSSSAKDNSLCIIQNAEGPIESDIYTLRITNTEGERRPMIDLAYPSVNCTSHHDTVIKKLGNKIHHLELYMDSLHAPHNGDDVIPDNFFAHVLTHCRNLKTLTFRNCDMFSYPHHFVDLDKRLDFLEKLELNGCIVNEGVLEQLSLSLPHIKKFVWYYTFDYSGEEDPPYGVLLENVMPSIIMPNSKIEMITLKTHHGEPTDLHVKLSLRNEQEPSYYHFRDHLEPATAEDYLAAKSHDRTYILTETSELKPRIEILTFWQRD